MEKEFEALESLNYIKEKFAMLEYQNENYIVPKKDLDTIEQAILELKSIKESKPSEAMKCLESLRKSANTFCQHIPEQCELNKKYADTIKQALLKVQEQEKENEILKEIIKSLFDRGCPLHQYNDTKFGLVIEVDDECSITHLGEFKGVDLDEKLKEVLK